MATINGVPGRVVAVQLSPESKALAAIMERLIMGELRPRLEAFPATPEQERRLAEMVSEECSLFAVMAEGPWPGGEALQGYAVDAARSFFESVVGKVGEG